MTDSFWLDAPYRPREPLSGRVDTQIAIVGGGLTGVQVALHLAREGTPCALLERDSIGSGATGRSAGLVLTGDHYDYPVSKHVLGGGRARRLWELTVRGGRMLEETIRAERIECTLRKTGSLRAAATPSEANLIRRAHDELAEDGFEVEPAEPPEGFHGAMRFPNDAELDPARLARGLGLAAERSGARVYESTPVLAAAESDGAATLRTPAGELRAEIVVGASNAWMRDVLPFFRDAIVPVRAQMLSTEPAPPGSVAAPTLFNYGREFARQLPTGEILFGGGRELEGRFFSTTEATPTVPVQRFLDASLAERFPRARGVRVARRWAGILGFSCDEFPDVGYLPGAVRWFACGGYTGRGLALSGALSRMAADLLLRGESELPYALFDPRRHT